MAAVTSLGNLFNTTAGSHAVTATPAVGDLIIILGASSDFTTAGTPPTDNNPDGSGTYSFIRLATSRSLDTVTAWVRNAPIRSATSTIFTYNPGTTTGGGLEVFKVTGIKAFGLAAIRGSGQEDNLASGGTPAPVLKNNAGATQAALTGNPLVGILQNHANPAAVTPPASFTESVDSGWATPTTGVETVRIDSGITASTITWGSTSVGGQYCTIVLEIETGAYQGPVWAPTHGPLPVFFPARPTIFVGSAPKGATLLQLDVAATFTAAFVRMPIKVFAIAGTFTVAFVKLISRTLAPAATFTTVFVKKVFRTLAATSTFTTVLLKTPNKVLAVTSTFTAAMTEIKLAILNLVVNSTFGVAMTKIPTHVLAATTTMTAVFAKKVIRTLALAGTMTTVLAKQVQRTLAVAATFTAVFVKKVFRTLALAAAWTTDLAKKPLRTLAATSTFTTALSKQPIKVLAATFTSILTLVTQTFGTVVVVAKDFIVRRQWTEGKRGGRWL